MVSDSARVLLCSRAPHEPSLDLQTTLGCPVFRGPEPAELERAVRSHRPWVVVTDVDPGPDPLSVVERVHRVAPDTRVLVTLEPADMSLAGPAMERGAEGFVALPLEPKALTHSLRRVLTSMDVAREVARLRSKGPLPELRIPGATMDEIEKAVILRCLDSTGGSTGKAAEILGISVRKIQYRLREWKESQPDLFLRQGNKIVVRKGRSGAPV